MPLPCSKRLWEASTREVWEVEYELYLGGRKGEMELRAGNLRMAMEGGCEVPKVGGLQEDVESDLGEWSKVVDGFGGVVLGCGLLVE